MILVLMGTNPYPFRRLMDAMGDFAEEADELVIVQSGNTPPDVRMQCKAFVDHEQIVRWIRSADVVVTQGGFGSLQDCIRARAHTVAVPRKVEENESVDDQTELVDTLAAEKLVIPVHDIAQLGGAIEEARTMQIPAPNVEKIQLHIADTVRLMVARA